MKTILLVDDEYALLESLEGLLQNEGYRVVTAANGEDALARFVEEKPDLVVTDLMMPLANGRELVRGIRALDGGSSTPVILMSASTKAIAITDAAGTIEVADFIRKPFEWDKLRAAVVRLMPAE